MTSRQYWRRRSFALENLVHAEADRAVEWILLLYEEAAARIMEQVESVYNTYSRKSGLNPEQVNALLSEKQTAQERQELLSLYQNATGPAKQDIWNRLAAPAYSYRISRLQATRDRVYSEVKAVYGPASDRVQNTLENAYTRSYYQTIFDIQQEAGGYFDFNRLNDNQVRVALATHWSGENYSERLWHNNQEFADAVEQAVVVGLLAGLRYDEMRDNLLHIIGMDSTQGAQYKAARLVRTECAYVCNEGHMEGYKEAEIENYIFLATLDTRTTETCRPLDMKRFPVDEAQPGTNMPPMHPNCRCTTMPDMSNGKLAKVRRAARDPVTGKYMAVPGDMTYQQWYAKYVEGNPAAEASEKKSQNRASDQKQYANYQRVLNGDAPKTFDEFQNLKYNDPGTSKR